MAPILILDPKTEQKIHREIILAAQRGDHQRALAGIARTLIDLHAKIPDDKRLSYGIVYTIKILSEHLYHALIKEKVAIYEAAGYWFTECRAADSQGVALGILSFYGLDHFSTVLPHFSAAAAGEDWRLREYAQGFFRKLIQRHPAHAKKFLTKLARSKNPKLRRFVSETLRPVQENKWLYKKPEYSLSILRLLFEEASPYPRTSVGNHLSDLARHLPELVYGLVADLVASGNKDSYWIATRACRNLVKKEPERVMNLLRVDEYRYKKTVVRR